MTATVAKPQVMKGSQHFHNVRTCRRCAEVGEKRHLEEAEKWAKQACDRIFSHYSDPRNPR